MNNLNYAKALVEEREEIQAKIQKHLTPFLKDFIEFMNETQPDYYDKYDQQADTFDCIDNETFHFTGEEIYEYGEDHKPSVSLPFSFVEDPEAYKAKVRKARADWNATQAAKRATAKAEQVARLEAQLAKARAELEEAEAAGTDPIKITATRNQLANAEKFR